MVLWLQPKRSRLRHYEAHEAHEAGLWPALEALEPCLHVRATFRMPPIWRWGHDGSVFCILDSEFRPLAWSLELMLEEWLSGYGVGSPYSAARTRCEYGDKLYSVFRLCTEQSRGFKANKDKEA